MKFIDWNNNGKIDPADIGVGIALDSQGVITDDDISQSEIVESTNSGSFTQALKASINKLLNRKRK